VSASLVEHPAVSNGCLNTSKLHENLYPWIATAKKLSLRALRQHSGRMLAMWLVAALLPIREDVLARRGD
jgi:hypothetical protein